MKRLIAITLAAGVLTGTLLIGSVRAERVKETITVAPDRTINSSEELTVSRAALKTLRHIVQARTDIHKKDLLHAQKELKECQTLFEIIKATMPTVRIKDHIWVAKEHLSYEDTKTVMEDLIPIYGSLDDIEDLAPMYKAREHINKAKKHLENGDKKGANEEFKLADEAVVFTEIDLPLRNTEKHVADAQMFLAKKEPEKADTALKSAEEGVQFLSIIDYSPLLQARKSLWQATKNYTAGKLEAAKQDIIKTKEGLVKAGKTIDAKTKTELDNIRKDIDSLEGKMNKFDHETEQELNKIHERLKAL